MFADYKANRPATPPEIKRAIPEVIEMLRNMDVPLLNDQRREADDIIGTVANGAWIADTEYPWCRRTKISFSF